MWRFRIIAFSFVWSVLAVAAAYAGQRQTISLNGNWQAGDSVSEIDMPSSYTHATPVPGLLDSATPPFQDVGKFASREMANHPAHMVKDFPPEAATAPVGISLQKRNYFWLRRTFDAPANRQIAILKVNKAQFGTAVWLNGKEVGVHWSCFTAGYFNLTGAMNWGGENVLVVRIGAHPATVPVTVPTGNDYEKLKWSPGIYDDVSVYFADNPIIETIQVSSRINTSEIVVQTRIRNYGESAAAFQLTHRVKPWKGGAEVGQSKPLEVTLGPGEEKIVTQMVMLRNPKLWTPEDPYLYVVESATGGDSSVTRFGMREFRFDRATGWAYLNNRPYFMRGANVTLHRFFEDPQCGNLPWREEWVRKLLIENPKRMHWNCFRFCIGPVPDRWLGIADEAGLLIQHEYFLWVLPDLMAHEQYDLIPEYQAWMRDSWNHPSVVIWDSSNEADYPVLGEKVVPAVRPLDLSNRPWENSVFSLKDKTSANKYCREDDPVERHPYPVGGRRFSWTYFENPPRIPRDGIRMNPEIVNEYGQFWLNRDGTPATLTVRIFEGLVGANATPEQRFETAAYHLAGETEFYRAYRNNAAVMHFNYLTAGIAGQYTGDNFRDVEKLILDPYFLDYVGEAFKPLGVYLNFWRSSVKADSTITPRVFVVNDYNRDLKGKLVLSVENGAGKVVARTETPFSIDAAGQGIYDLKITVPKTVGECLLKAIAIPSVKLPEGQTVSRRKFRIVPE